MTKFKELFEAKMSDSEITSALNALAKNGDDKAKTFATGMLSYHKENGSYHPNQVAGLQNIMKNASFQMAKKDKEVNERVKFINIKNEDIVEFNFEDGSVLTFEKNGSKWQEGEFESGSELRTKPHGWGSQRYMGYLTSEDLYNYISSDYDLPRLSSVTVA